MPREVYAFREVDEDDVPLIDSWIQQSHWREAWGDAGIAIGRVYAAMGDDASEPLIVELAGRPVAYLRSFDPHMDDGHPYQDQPFGTLVLDLSIGPADLVGKGHGAAILRQFAATLFDEGAPRLITDPHPDNVRAIKAYEKAGVRHFDTRHSIYGSAHMMALDAPEEIEP